MDRFMGKKYRKFVFFTAPKSGFPADIPLKPKNMDKVSTYIMGFNGIEPTTNIGIYLTLKPAKLGASPNQDAVWRAKNANDLHSQFNLMVT